MRVKQKPEDFSVKESYRFDEVPTGRFRVYLMDKQKLSTYDAVDRVRERFGLRPGAISYCGLKDKQGRTEQIIAVDGADVDMQDTDLRLKPLGRTDRELSAANITSNRFSVTVRDLDRNDIPALNMAAAEVNRLGVVNYFDSQRFGSLKHGQGFIAKDLLRGDFEAALKNHLAKPSPLDRTEDAKVKQFWKENWGKWTVRVPFAGNKRYFRILQSLRQHPEDYARAFLQIDASYRAMLLFTYQSYLWNEGARRYLQLRFDRKDLFPAPYQAGSVLFHRDASPEMQRELKHLTFPLLSPDTELDDPVVAEAVNWALGKEKMTLEKLRVPQVGQRLYFKHEDRPLVVYPGKLVIGRVQPDEINRGRLKLNVAFTLPPGAYATLVIKRLFHASWHEETKQELLDSQHASYAAREAAEAEPESATGARGRAPASRTGAWDEGRRAPRVSAPRDPELAEQSPRGPRASSASARPSSPERRQRAPGGASRGERGPTRGDGPARTASAGRDGAPRKTAARSPGTSTWGVGDRPARRPAGDERPSRRPAGDDRPARRPAGDDRPARAPARSGTAPERASRRPSPAAAGADRWGDSERSSRPPARGGDADRWGTGNASERPARRPGPATPRARPVSGARKPPTSKGKPAPRGGR